MVSTASTVTAATDFSKRFWNIYVVITSDDVSRGYSDRKDVWGIAGCFEHRAEADAFAERLNGTISSRGTTNAQVRPSSHVWVLIDGMGWRKSADFINSKLYAPDPTTALRFVGTPACWARDIHAIFAAYRFPFTPDEDYPDFWETLDLSVARAIKAAFGDAIPDNVKTAWYNRTREKVARPKRTPETPDA